jgi:hypothetical protein
VETVLVSFGPNCLLSSKYFHFTGQAAQSAQKVGESTFHEQSAQSAQKVVESAHFPVGIEPPGS